MARAYRPNDAGYRAIAVSPEVRAALRAVAEKGKAHAEAISADFRITGDYMDSFEVADTTVLDWRGEYPGPRAAARLVNTSDHAAAVEWGYKGRSSEPTTSAHRVLGRTLEFLDGTG